MSRSTAMLRGKVRGLQACKQGHQGRPHPTHRVLRTYLSRRRARHWDRRRWAPRPRGIQVSRPISEICVITHNTPFDPSSGHAHSHLRFPPPCSLNWNACVQRKPRPSLEAPPPKPVSTERTCVKVRPRPYPLFSAESLGSLSLSPHSSRCRSRVSGREQRRAASPPPSGRAPARSLAPSSSHPGPVPEGPSRCRVPEGHRGRRHGS